MKYAYEDLSPEQFEKLVILICQRIFGMGTQGFSTGPDGGRDGKFVGKANEYPSHNTPWEGVVIIQAKHTNGHNKSFSETEFFSKKSKSCIVAQEVEKIKKLIEKKKLNHYILFSNRRLAANANEEIISFIAANTGLDQSSIALCGVDNIERFLDNYADISKIANLDPIEKPLIINPNEISEIIQLLSKHINNSSDLPVEAPTVDRTLYEEKNKLNNMDDEYAKYQLKLYLKDTKQIDDFLGAPDNLHIANIYESIVCELQSKIISFRKDFHEFNRVMEYILDLIFARDQVLCQGLNKKLTRRLLFYMYWNCDIGRSAKND